MSYFLPPYACINYVLSPTSLLIHAEIAADGVIHNNVFAGKQSSRSMETASGFLSVTPNVPAATIAAA